MQYLKYTILCYFFNTTIHTYIGENLTKYAKFEFDSFRLFAERSVASKFSHS